MVFRTDIPLFVICTAPLWSIYLLRCCINRCIAVNVCDKECVKFPCALCWTPVVGRRLQSLPSVFYCIPGEVFYCLCVVKVFYVVRGPGVNANRAVWGGAILLYRRRRRRRRHCRRNGPCLLRRLGKNAFNYETYWFWHGGIFPALSASRTIVVTMNFWTRYICTIATCCFTVILQFCSVHLGTGSPCYGGP